MPHSTTPRHIAIIMDGNNRYGKAHALPTGAGHVKGKDALDPIVEHCLEKGVQVLTVFAFSSENWARPKVEVDLLMDLLAKSINEQIPRMDKYQVRLRFIGDRSGLSADLAQLMAQAEAQTAHFTRMTLVIAISYGGQWDIANAAKTLAQKVAAGEMAGDDISVQTMAEQMALADCPPVDMLIRTGGEYRISNFLLWQAAYAELFFTPTLWPEFGTAELDEMMAQFANRERRFGKTSEQVQGKQVANER
ncbi:di-trans,poly-cis-decaprenylcistransferase [Moraxella caviae]|uniref:Ditrans,polycis-undecaprenyl-diphosphate synthase ((2E,6E)-farnesyl-diphosphate specific) n=1 Tax=Moraxella caviae TaxID=34060 RepID=A0A1T0A2F7_9GAMM|nr:polyprenyl diphosphate synthase [Moraxella caviae]OOR89933.1 di-trans,poly-cis-decaprenylcistransferase [Moraxella caviae]STZ14318.1 Undecaprenyl pyrophosphate synthase [Moraxella caviae]